MFTMRNQQCFMGKKKSKIKIEYSSKIFYLIGKKGAPFIQSYIFLYY